MQKLMSGCSTLRRAQEEQAGSKEGLQSMLTAQMDEVSRLKVSDPALLQAAVLDPLPTQHSVVCDRRISKSRTARTQDIMLYCYILLLLYFTIINSL